jgi:hypothetical protein
MAAIEITAAADILVATISAAGPRRCEVRTLSLHPMTNTQTVATAITTKNIPYPVDAVAEMPLRGDSFAE